MYLGLCNWLPWSMVWKIVEECHVIDRGDAGAV